MATLATQGPEQRTERKQWKKMNRPGNRREKRTEREEEISRVEQRQRQQVCVEEVKGMTASGKKLQRHVTRAVSARCETRGACCVR